MYLQLPQTVGYGAPRHCIFTIPRGNSYSPRMEYCTHTVVLIGWSTEYGVQYIGDINAAPLTPSPVPLSWPHHIDTVSTISCFYPGCVPRARTRAQSSASTRVSHSTLGFDWPRSLGYIQIHADTYPTDSLLSSSDRIFASQGKTDDVGSLAVQACRCGRCSLAPELACVGVSARHSQSRQSSCHC